MIPAIDKLVNALREELTQYGEMLALLDQQQEFVVAHAADEVLHTVSAVNQQTALLKQAREYREQSQASLAGKFNLPSDTPFQQLIPFLPEDYRPLVKALVQENNELLVRIQQRARQNHILLSRSLDLMQRFMSTLFPGMRPPVYDCSGSLLAPVFPRSPTYEAVG
jgi:flagellar biosynthesis/type III secretory pathway chaperone